VHPRPGRIPRVHDPGVLPRGYLVELEASRMRWRNPLPHLRRTPSRGSQEPGLRSYCGFVRISLVGAVKGVNSAVTRRDQTVQGGTREGAAYLSGETHNVRDQPSRSRVPGESPYPSTRTTHPSGPNRSAKSS
jgi:hypothetical protein